jgi:hypothetical protein
MMNISRLVNPVDPIYGPSPSNFQTRVKCAINPKSIDQLMSLTQGALKPTIPSTNTCSTSLQLDSRLILTYQKSYKLISSPAQWKFPHKRQAHVPILVFELPLEPARVLNDGIRLEKRQ